MTAQELRDVIESALDDDDFLVIWRRKSFQALLRLVDDVERWKAVVIDVDEDGVDFPTVDILLKELRDYTYGEKGKE